MVSRGLLVLVALALCAACATGTAPETITPSVSAPAAGHGFASPVGPDVPRCSSGLGYNRATGLCVSGGP